MSEHTCRPCPVCNNSLRSLMRPIETVEGILRQQCMKCEAIFFEKPIYDLPLYDSDYNRYFLNAGDIAKAGIMAAKLGWFCKKNLKDPKIFEAGLGNGLTAWLLKKQGFFVEGIDLDMRWCNELMEELNMSVYTGKFEKWAAPYAYDLIYSSHVIEHTENVLGFMRKAYEILNPEGFFWLETPDVHFCDNDPLRWHHFATRNSFEHLCLLGCTSIDRLAEKVGFTVVDIERQFKFQSLRAILKKSNKNRYEALKDVKIDQNS